MTRSRGTAVAVSLVVGAACAQQIGAAVAVTVWPMLGATGIVFVRFTVATLVMVTVRRPPLFHLSRVHWLTAAALAVAVATMSLAFYNATGRIPLGIAVTIEVIGPLVLSVIAARRGEAILWAVTAFGGVALLGLTPENLGGSLDALGILCAAVAAVAWAVYIQLSARAAGMFDQLDALTLASFFGALLVAPLAITSGGLRAVMDGHVAALVVLVAFMSSVIPFSMEMKALKSLPPGTFAVLTSLTPAIAAFVGLVMLDQHLAPTHYVAIALVTVAAVGAVRTAQQNSPAHSTRGRPSGSARPPVSSHSDAA